MIQKVVKNVDEIEIDNSQMTNEILRAIDSYLNEDSDIEYQNILKNVLDYFDFFCENEKIMHEAMLNLMIKKI